MVIAFDGKCGLCDGFVRFMLRHDHRQAFQFAASTSREGAAIFASAGQDPAEPTSVVLVTGDKVYLESDAMIRSVAALGGVFRLATILRIVPKAVRDIGYRYVGRNRYRWFGRQSTCALHESGWSERFLP